MAYLPPAVVGLLLVLAVFCGIMMMVAIHVRMRGELEPLSRRTRWFLIGSLAFITGAGWLMYRLFEHILDT
jgi:hypothetical protein